MGELKLKSMIMTAIYALTGITIKIKPLMAQNWCHTQLQIMTIGKFKKNDPLESSNLSNA
jgi:hypothetical protein